MLKDYIELLRPFTLLGPTIGFLAMVIVALQSAPKIEFTSSLLIPIILGAIVIAVGNAMSNVFNQIYDLEIDRINKPARPISSGRIGVNAARNFGIALFIFGVVLAWFVNLQFFILGWITLLFILSYSVPPLRLKRFGLIANITIAIPRGLFIILAGWAVVKPIVPISPEPWFIGTVLFLYVLGAATTKDFADIKGDARYGIRTLPIMFGVKKAVYLMSPAFVVPFLLIPIGVAMGWVVGSAIWLILLALWGAYIVYLVLRNPEAMALEGNHPSWIHMYLLLMVAQIGFAIAYLV
ncbi:MAG: hypothetical protein CL943_00330 [Candidatus Diapherotrites archaeon]|uniref:UbiA family prenyltransferase n=1 Tax=Candidatus Iainarchaeum sp. TaxID=3101447 RepID=A0A2D6LZY7_9ARCH|nr:hypothetical protein [Candidatus Diapherotrites archaeon]|tara:strand:+ start:4466 stop:5350 length:885 start_codon:yes stop_codon:yes gene_type:complete